METKVEVMDIYVNLEDLIEEYGLDVEFQPVKSDVGSLYRLKNYGVFVYEDVDLVELQKRPYIVGREFRRHIVPFKERLEKVVNKLFPPSFGRRSLIPVGRAPNYLRVQLSPSEGRIAPVFYGKFVGPKEVGEVEGWLRNFLDEVSVFMIYGFVSVQALEGLRSLSESLGPDMIVLSLSALPSSDSEGRQVIYGPDIGKLREETFKPLGGALPKEVLVNLLDSYAPGTSVYVDEARYSSECSELGDYYRSLVEDLQLLLESPVLDSWQYEVTYRLMKEVFEEVDLCGLSGEDFNGI